MSHFEQFYIHPHEVGADTFSLSGIEYHHAVRVLRKQAGAWLTAVDGEGHRYAGPITRIDKERLEVRIERRDAECGEPRFRLVLAQAIPKGGVFDWIIEKGTEIGVSAFQPMQTARSVVQTRGREGRWTEKARAAMKQCGRSRCPLIHPVRRFAEVIDHFSQWPLFIAHPGSAAAPLSWLQGVSGAEGGVLLIGPEGGFTEEEVELALIRGAYPLSLGVRRLRSETAALAGAVRLLAEAGELV